MKGLFAVIIGLLLGFTENALAWNAPTLVYPSTGASVWTGLTLDWSAVTSSTGYQLQVDINSAFNSPQKLNTYKTYINSSSANTDTEHYLSDIFFGTTYYWRVRAFVAGDTSAWIQSSFITKDFVSQNSPASGSNAWTGVLLDWDAHTGVDFYDMEADTVPTFSSPAKKSGSKSYINSNSSNTDTEFYLDDLYFGKTYYWRVRARNAVDTCSWSSPRTFITMDYVTMVSPATGSNAWAGVLLDWSAHAGVDFYDVEADTVPTFSSPAKKSGSNAYINSNSSNSDTEFYLNDLYFGKTYYWRVRARNAVDTCSWSSPRTFITVDYVIMVSPATGSNAWAGVLLDWSAHAGVDFYDVEADTVPTFSSAAKKSGSNAYINSNSSNTDTEFYLDNLYFGKTYYWRVRARNAVDTCSWSSSRTFNTVDYVTLVSPATGSNTWAGVVLDWSAHPGVDFYDMEADTISTFSSPAKKSSSNAYINSNSSNSDTEFYLDNLYFGKTYYWRVRARNAVDTCSWSSIRTFNTVDYVTLVSPANAALNVNPSTAYLNWDAHTGLDMYQIQLDTISLFNSGNLISMNKNYINSNSSNTDTELYPGTLLSNHTYFWRVRGINAVDTTVWTLREFSTGPTLIMIPSIPNLISPANTAINQPVTINLQWAAAPNANDYEYIIAENPQFSNPVATGFSSSIQVSIPGLNLNNYTYYWKVRSRNSLVAYSEWSDVWHFTTGCNAAMPGGTNDTVCSGLNATLTASGASQYRWYDALSGGNLLFTGNPYILNAPAQTQVVYVCSFDVSCESARLPLTAFVLPTPAQPVITQVGNTIYSSPGATYQWYLAGTLLSNASGQFFTPPVNGSYTVEITNSEGCSSMSSPFNFIISGVESLSQNDLDIYPNPAVDQVIVKSFFHGNYSICIIDIYGNKLAEKEVSTPGTSIVNMNNYPAGIYVVKIISKGKTVCRLLQLIK